MLRCPYCGQQNEDEAPTCAHCNANLNADIYARDELQPIAIGTIFDNKFEVLGEIGRGGMGFVYLGIDRSLNRHVAIKVLPEMFNTGADMVARFQKEAHAMAMLDHPNLAPVYAFGREFNCYYLVMKYLEGDTVGALLEKRVEQGLPPGFPPEEVRRIVIEICKGLGHAHKRGLIHRDIKPNNIMISPEGQVTIMDFGIVKEQSTEERLTRAGLVFGTPEYLAPEQAQGLSPPGPITDLYSLGIVAYEMLTGEPPFQGESPFAIVFKHIQEMPEPLVGRVPGVTESLQAAIFKAIEKDPNARYQNAAEMQSAFEAVRLGEDAPQWSEESVSRHWTPPPPCDLYDDPPADSLYPTQNPSQSLGGRGYSTQPAYPPTSEPYKISGRLDTHQEYDFSQYSEGLDNQAGSYHSAESGPPRSSAALRVPLGSLPPLPQHAVSQHPSASPVARPSLSVPSYQAPSGTMRPQEPAQVSVEMYHSFETRGSGSLDMRRSGDLYTGEPYNAAPGYDDVYGQNQSIFTTASAPVRMGAAPVLEPQGQGLEQEEPLELASDEDRSVARDESNARWHGDSETVSKDLRHASGRGAESSSEFRTTTAEFRVKNGLSPQKRSGFNGHSSPENGKKGHHYALFWLTLGLMTLVGGGLLVFALLHSANDGGGASADAGVQGKTRP